jgi:hypothetical protein
MKELWVKLKTPLLDYVTHVDGFVTKIQRSRGKACHKGVCLQHSGVTAGHYLKNTPSASNNHIRPHLLENTGSRPLSPS